MSDRLIDANGVIALLDSPEEIRAFWEREQYEALTVMDNSRETGLEDPRVFSIYEAQAARFRRATVELRNLRKASAPCAVISPLPPSTPAAPGAPSPIVTRAEALRIGIDLVRESRLAWGARYAGGANMSRPAADEFDRAMVERLRAVERVLAGLLVELEG